MRLVRNEAEHVVKAALADGARQLFEMVAAADEQEHNLPVFAQQAGGGKDGIELVRAPEVAGVADDKFLREAPFSPQRVCLLCNRPKLLVVAPVRDHMHARLILEQRSYALGHALAHDHVGNGALKRAITQAAQRAQGAPRMNATPSSAAVSG